MKNRKNMCCKKFYRLIANSYIWFAVLAAVIVDIMLHIQTIVITRDSLVITFIGVIAGIIVIGNFAQVQAIKDEFKSKVDGIDNSLRDVGVRVGDMKSKISDVEGRSTNLELFMDESKKDIEASISKIKIEKESIFYYIFIGMFEKHKAKSDFGDALSALLEFINSSLLNKANFNELIDSNKQEVMKDDSFSNTAMLNVLRDIEHIIKFESINNDSLEYVNSLLREIDLISNKDYSGIDWNTCHKLRSNLNHFETIKGLIKEYENIGQ